nr:MAG TPA: hypothetical protein [Caudoviricetes sp.]
MILWGGLVFRILEINMLKLEKEPIHLVQN